MELAALAVNERSKVGFCLRLYITLIVQLLLAIYIYILYGKTFFCELTNQHTTKLDPSRSLLPKKKATRLGLSHAQIGRF